MTKPDIGELWVEDEDGDVLNVYPFFAAPGGPRLLLDINGQQEVGLDLEGAEQLARYLVDYLREAARATAGGDR